MSSDPHSLQRVERDGVTLLTDVGLRENHGIAVAFSERSGGVSASPYTSLNLAGHVGDDPHAVDENRSRLMLALEIETQRDRLITAEQVHGDAVEIVDGTHAGRGACVSRPRAPVGEADGLATTSVELPLLMMYADCVPIILVCVREPRGVAVVHAGWKGTLARIPGKAARELSALTGNPTEEMLAYIGPHIDACCYEVDDDRVSQFANAFVTIAAAGGHLNLSTAVRESLTDCGIGRENIVEAELCTHDHADRFYSFRAEPTTGRHGAIAVIDSR